MTEREPPEDEEDEERPPGRDLERREPLEPEPSDVEEPRTRHGYVPLDPRDVAERLMRSQPPGDLMPPEGDDDEDDEPPTNSEALNPYQPRKRFRAATNDELDPQSFMVADDRSALRAVLRGGSIAEDRGDAQFIGGAIRRLAQALRETAEQFRAGTTGFISNPLLRSVQFGHSVVVELEISAEEDVQLGLDQGRHSPTIDAAHALSQLLAAPSPDELLSRALDLGPDAVASYKRFLNHLAGDRVTLEWQTPDATEVVVVSSTEAAHDFAILDREGERRTDPVEVPGTLTMADSELRQFALTLPSELQRPPLLKGKHRVRGTYAEEMGERLKSEGLWDSEVMATINVTYDVPDTTPTPRDPVYELVDAESLIPPDAPSLFEDR